MNKIIDTICILVLAIAFLLVYDFTMRRSSNECKETMEAQQIQFDTFKAPRHRK